MFKSLNNVDWHLLHQQKLILLKMMNSCRKNSVETKSLEGIISLLDTIQDEAAEAGIWDFPVEEDDKDECEICESCDNIEAHHPDHSMSRRYYVEDENGHHYGPIEDYENAVHVASAINGRIIVL